jgi:restriction endonuclease Mrr
MLQFRKQIELSFAIESNQLTTVMKHRKVPVRGTERVQSFFAMQDMSRLITAQIAHIRKNELPEEHIQQIKQMSKQQYKQIVLDVVA